MEGEESRVQQLPKVMSSSLRGSLRRVGLCPRRAPYLCWSSRLWRSVWKSRRSRISSGVSLYCSRSSWMTELRSAERRSRSCCSFLRSASVTSPSGGETRRDTFPDLFVLIRSYPSYRSFIYVLMERFFFCVHSVKRLST